MFTISRVCGYIQVACNVASVDYLVALCRDHMHVCTGDLRCIECHCVLLQLPPLIDDPKKMEEVSSLVSWLQCALVRLLTFFLRDHCKMVKYLCHPYRS